MKLERRPHAQINRIRYRIMGDKGRVAPPPIRGARRVGKTYVAEEIGRRIASDAFVKLDFQTDLELIAPLFDCPTDDVDTIVARISDYKRTPIRKETAFILFDEVQLCERALNSLRFFRVRAGAYARPAVSSASPRASASCLFPAAFAKRPCTPCRSRSFSGRSMRSRWPTLFVPTPARLRPTPRTKPRSACFIDIRSWAACPLPSTHIARRYPSKTRASSSVKSTRPTPPI